MPTERKLNRRSAGQGRVRAGHARTAAARGRCGPNRLRDATARRVAARKVGVSPPVASSPELSATSGPLSIAECGALTGSGPAPRAGRRRSPRRRWRRETAPPVAAGPARRRLRQPRRPRAPRPPARLVRPSPRPPLPRRPPAERPPRRHLPPGPAGGAGPRRRSRSAPNQSLCQPTDNWPASTARATAATPPGGRPFPAPSAVAIAVTATVGSGWQARARG